MALLTQTAVRDVRSQMAPVIPSSPSSRYHKQREQPKTAVPQVLVRRWFREGDLCKYASLLIKNGDIVAFHSPIAAITFHEGCALPEDHKEDPHSTPPAAKKVRTFYFQCLTERAMTVAVSALLLKQHHRCTCKVEKTASEHILSGKKDLPSIYKYKVQKQSREHVVYMLHIDDILKRVPRERKLSTDS